MAGLSKKHHSELNGVRTEQSRYDELRLEYAGDPKALEQIDRYDPTSFYKKNLQRIRDKYKK